MTFNEVKANDEQKIWNNSNLWKLNVSKNMMTNISLTAAQTHTKTSLCITYFLAL